MTEAVKARIEQIRRQKGYGRYERIMAIANRTAPALRDMPDIDDYLYDAETGLPK